MTLGCIATVARQGDATVEAFYSRTDASARASVFGATAGMGLGALAASLLVPGFGAVAAAGADTFVAGSAIFGAKDYRATIAAMIASLLSK